MSNNRKGIILAGGIATRLYPISKSVSKQLMPVYDKPMIYYPLSILMMAEIRDILIITRPNDKENFQSLLGNGDQLGISISYKTQKSPDGIAQSFLIGENFILNSDSALILGDNIFYGSYINKLLKNANDKKEGATIFSYKSKNPENYGVIEHKDNKIISIDEKPKNPKSNFIVTGLYFYDGEVVEYAKSLKPSKRGEYEITDINNMYIEKNKMNCEFMDDSFVWLDTGTHDSLLEAGNFISKIEKEKKIKVYCPEEISFRKKWISKNKLNEISNKSKNTNYGKYLKNIVEKN
jgi:glucose-1-phosphate thymidylyltransferase